MADYASEGGHFYLPNGSPYYTVISKSTGQERPATIRDARKVGALPGVSTILKESSKPGLDRYFRKGIFIATRDIVQELQPITGPLDWDMYFAEAEKRSKEEGQKAAERGVAIHAAIEKHYRGEQPDEDLWPWVQEVKAVIDAECGPQKWRAERSFASPAGYGGKTDLSSGEVLIDMKSKDGDVAQGTLTTYLEHAMQLAAYREGLGIPGARCGILFVGRDVPSARLVELTETELAQGWECFKALLAFWRAKTGYAP